MDIFLNFRTTYVNSRTNIEIVDPNKVALHYVKSIRFPFDILASIPFELFLKSDLENNDVNISDEESTFQYQLFGILKLIRLFRLGRIFTYMQMTAAFRTWFRIFSLIFGFLVIVHWVTCVWYILINTDESIELGWIPTKDLDMYKTNFYILDDLYQYCYVFHYSILLILGNEIAPVTLGQLIFASLVMLGGQIITAFIFGNMAALMS